MTDCARCNEARAVFQEAEMTMRKVGPVKHRSYHDRIKCPDCGSEYVMADPEGNLISTGDDDAED